MNLYCHYLVNFGGADRLVFEDGEPTGQATRRLPGSEELETRVEPAPELHVDREEITPETTRREGANITTASLGRLENIDGAQALANEFNRIDPTINQNATQWGITNLRETFNICYVASRGDISTTERILRREIRIEIAHERERGREALTVLGQNFIRYANHEIPGFLDTGDGITDSDIPRILQRAIDGYAIVPQIRETAAKYIGLPPKSPGNNWNYRWSEIRQAMGGALGER